VISTSRGSDWVVLKLGSASELLGRRGARGRTGVGCRPRMDAVVDAAGAGFLTLPRCVWLKAAAKVTQRPK
jgi:hypothetical protein